MELLLGIDCGGSSTRAVVANASGQVVGVGISGASNPNVLSTEATAENIRQATASALKQADVSHENLVAVFVGMAGVVGETDLAHGRSILLAAGIDSTRILTGLDHDIRIALAGGLTGREGLALIVGTGASCYGRRADGFSWQAGGWGSILDDGGSAFGLGQAAMRAAVRITDHRLPWSVLLEEVMSALKLDNPRQIVDLVYRQGMTKTQVAALAPMVIQAWQRGDALAAEVVSEGINELAWIVEAAAKKLQIAKPMICYTGGLVENSAEYRLAIVQRIESRIAGATVVAPILPPVLGAILLAYEMANFQHDAETWHRLQQSHSQHLIYKKL